MYIHIPFCNHICTYCDFCKRYYDEKFVSKYLDSLSLEIDQKYQKEKLKTLYIGGGTPSSLSINDLEKLSNIIKKINLDENYEFTIEVNPENINEEKLLIMKKMGVNRISMGVESTSDKFLKYLGRCHNYLEVQEKIKLMKKIGFNNINVDLIYAIPNETIIDLKNDLDNILKLDINHISTYSLMINDNTVLGIQKVKNISEDLDSEMYYYISSYLQEKGFTHYEISNFSKDDHHSHHNLVYWKNEEYYGIGLGASGYFNNIRYDNTKSMNNYLKGKYLLNKEELSKNDIVSYELILGFRLINGINKKEFYKKYNMELIEQYNIKELIEKGYLIDDGENIKISYNNIYIENSILVNFI